MLLTRLPLEPKLAFDLHVLGIPPAFILSQDQTLHDELLHQVQDLIFRSFSFTIVDSTLLPTSLQLSFLNGMDFNLFFIQKAVF